MDCSDHLDGIRWVDTRSLDHLSLRMLGKIRKRKNNECEMATLVRFLAPSQRKLSLVVRGKHWERLRRGEADFFLGAPTGNRACSDKPERLVLMS